MEHEAVHMHYIFIFPICSKLQLTIRIIHQYGQVQQVDGSCCLVHVTSCSQGEKKEALIHFHPGSSEEGGE